MPRPPLSVYLSLALPLACSGELGSASQSTGSRGDAPEGGIRPSPTAPPLSDAGPASGSPASPSVDGGASPLGSGSPPTAALDPGFKGIHRLSNREYDNTVQDLLGTTLTPGTQFLQESGEGFDNIATSLGLTTTQYAAYLRAAEDVTRDVFDDADKRARVLPCDPAADTQCVQTVLDGLGKRAFRRPLESEERATYLAVYQRAVALGVTPQEGVAQVVRALLSSAEFLFRLEFDMNPGSATPHELSPFELATRLSYFLWSSQPDAELFDAAERGELGTDAALTAQLERMLQSERAGALIDSFAWQWLGLQALESHAVLNDVFPDWNEELRASMLTQARLYLSEFVREGRSWNEFLTSETSFLDAHLADHTGEDTVQGSDFVRREQSANGRVGFMGLPAFLTLSSFAHRTSPTLRAKWVLEQLWCSPPPPPPANMQIPDLDADEAANQAALLSNVRARLELHRSDPGCASCHNFLDPLGLALENFDAVGRYREQYDNGDAIDPSGELPDGTPLSGLSSLAQTVQADPRFARCTTQKLLTYALGRGVNGADAPAIDQLVASWQAAEPTFPRLVKHIALSVPFRTRRGENE